MAINVFNSSPGSTEAALAIACNVRIDVCARVFLNALLMVDAGKLLIFAH